LIFAIFLALIGIWLIMEPKRLMESITFFIGLIITLYGLLSLGLAYSGRKRSLN
jgi:xanthine/uracil/vitamin C permease (AzgA family)